MTFPITAWIGGGNMASAIIGGLRAAGAAADRFIVLEPNPEQRARLRQQFGIEALGQAQAELAQAEVVVWAVKPQSFAEAATAVRPHLGDPLHLSIMAGVRAGAIERRAAARRIVRCMPNTPALIGRGIAGLYANPACGQAERGLAEQLLAPTGELLWVDSERGLDAVTALSGSGPAYVFYLVEAMCAAGVELGLPAASAKQLALATFAGAAELAARSALEPGQLREQVTSKGGTTAAALTVLGERGVAAAFAQALRAAAQRAAELGDALDA